MPNNNLKYTVLVGGATGQQGGAVIKALRERGYTVIAYVRSADSLKAKALADMGIELAEGDLADTEALGRAAAKADAIFSVTVPFGENGMVEEIAQGKALADVAVRYGKHLVYSSVAGATSAAQGESVEHVTSKQIIEAYLKAKGVWHTIIAPFYLMENLLNFDFNHLRNDVYAFPLTPQRKLDQVTALDVARMAVYAIEHADAMAGKRVEVASDSISGEEIVAILSDILGREITYMQLPIEQVRRFAGDEIATMFEKFENDSYHLDIAALHAQYPEVRWHTFESWARQLDWKALLGEQA